MLLGCIADDFTGATDLANTLTRRGMHTVQTIGLPRGDAPAADAIVVAARTGSGPSPEDGVSLFLVPRATPGLEVKLLPTMDQTRKLCEVTLDGVRVAAGNVLGAANGGGFHRRQGG